jgi:hypothetical protein
MVRARRARQKIVSDRGVALAGKRVQPAEPIESGLPSLEDVDGAGPSNESS